MTYWKTATLRKCSDCDTVETAPYQFKDCPWESCEGSFCGECAQYHFDIFKTAACGHEAAVTAGVENPVRFCEDCRPQSEMDVARQALIVARLQFAEALAEVRAADGPRWTEGLLVNGLARLDEVIEGLA